MSRTSYYYDPPGSLTLVERPGECCDYCGELARIMPAGSLVPMPCTAIDEEYGSREGDVHMHLECAHKWLATAQEEVKQGAANIAKWTKP